jgi:peptidoglycan/xylan/chitin deacetylase (PgdA/CDA1 family)
MTRRPKPVESEGAMTNRFHSSRRQFLAGSAAAVGAGFLGRAMGATETARPRRAQIAITLDLEMARNFPTWETAHWDYEKGNLNDETKAYAVEAARRVKAAGGVAHFFLVGRALEQPNVDWLKQLVQTGHRIGNHTYDHVNLLAQKPEEIQFRFKRCPWLIEGRQVADVIRENIALANAAIKTRLGVDAAGFRTPGGFAEGLAGREDLQKILRELGFTWVSAKYPSHKNSDPGKEPTPNVLADIVRAQQSAQPFKYPTGLVEIPMSPISDIGAFRNGRWKLDWFLKAIRLGVEWAIEHGTVYDFLAHPACLYVTDRKFETIDLICDMVKTAGADKAAIIDLDTIARGVSAS